MARNDRNAFHAFPFVGMVYFGIAVSFFGSSGYAMSLHGRKAQALGAIDACKIFMDDQRAIERDEFTDFMLKAATMDVIMYTNEDDFDLEELKRKLLDSSGSSVTDQTAYFPEADVLPNHILEVFVKYACKYQRDGNSEVEIICSGDAPQFSDMPSEAMIRLANVDDDDKEVVVDNICSETVQNWHDAVANVLEHYLVNGLATIRAKTTTDPTATLATAAATTTTTTASTASPMVGASSETRTKTTTTPAPQTSTTIESMAPQTLPTEAEPLSNTTDFVHLPPFLLVLLIEADFLSPDQVEVRRQELLDKTTTFLYDALMETSEHNEQFVNMYLNMFIQKKVHQSRRRSRSLRSNAHGKLTALFEGIAYYQGEAPSVDELKVTFVQALESKHFLKAVRGSSNPSLKSTERVRVMFQEDVGEANAAMAASPQMHASAVLFSILGFVVSVLVMSAGFVYLYEWHLHRTAVNATTPAKQIAKEGSWNLQPMQVTTRKQAGATISSRDKEGMKPPTGNDGGGETHIRQGSPHSVRTWKKGLRHEVDVEETRASTLRGTLSEDGTPQTGPEVESAWTSRPELEDDQFVNIDLDNPPPRVAASTPRVKVEQQSSKGLVGYWKQGSEVSSLSNFTS